MISLTLVGLAKDDIDNTDVTEVFFQENGSHSNNQETHPHSLQLRPIILVFTCIYKMLQDCHSKGSLYHAAVTEVSAQPMLGC